MLFRIMLISLSICFCLLAPAVASGTSYYEKELTRSQITQVRVDNNHKKMIDNDNIFDSLNKEDKAVFIRYWVDHYSKKHNTKVNGNKAVQISINETGLGSAGVGRSKNNIFGCKIDNKGRFISKFPSYSNHRDSVEALIVFYKKYSEWNLWSGVGTDLGLDIYSKMVK